MGSNAYLLDLPCFARTSFVFNIVNLTAYGGEPTDSVDLETLPVIVPTQTSDNLIDDVIRYSYYPDEIWSSPMLLGLMTWTSSDRLFLD